MLFAPEVSMQHVNAICILLPSTEIKENYKAITSTSCVVIAGILAAMLASLNK